MSESPKEELHAKGVRLFLQLGRGRKDSCPHFSSRAVVFILPLSSLGFEASPQLQVWSQRDISDWCALLLPWLAVLPPWSRSSPLGSHCFFEHHLLFRVYVCLVSLFNVLWVERNGLKSSSGCVSVCSHSSICGSCFMNFDGMLSGAYIFNTGISCVFYPLYTYYLLKSGLPWPT